MEEGKGSEREVDLNHKILAGDFMACSSRKALLSEKNSNLLLGTVSGPREIGGTSKKESGSLSRPSL